MDGLLPDGPETEGHHLYLLRGRPTAREVGVLWIAVQDSGVGRAVWIYDVRVYEPFRNAGHGTRALRAVEKKAAELGADRVELHVFGHNPAARALYERLGYERLGYDTMGVVMRRRLGRA